MIQPEDLESVSDTASLVLMIDDAKLGDMKAAMAEIAELACVSRPAVWLRVETMSS